MAETLTLKTEAPLHWVAPVSWRHLTDPTHVQSDQISFSVWSQVFHYRVSDDEFQKAIYSWHSNIEACYPKGQHFMASCLRLLPRAQSASQFAATKLGYMDRVYSSTVWKAAKEVEMCITQREHVVLPGIKHRSPVCRYRVSIILVWYP